MIHLDTALLVKALTGERTEAAALRERVRDGIRLGLCTIVLYEWWRGPRTQEELADQELLFPARAAASFGIREAAIAADLYVRLKNPPRREIDIAIAACAIAQGASLWTLNRRDFQDIPGLDVI
jgi:predicted nucleic acid-binding protein